MIPDSPQQLANIPEITKETIIGLNWSDGDYNGGSSVIDYTLSFDQGSGNFITLASGIS